MHNYKLLQEHLAQCHDNAYFLACYLYMTDFHFDQVISLSFFHFSLFLSLPFPLFQLE